MYMLKYNIGVATCPSCAHLHLEHSPHYNICKNEWTVSPESAMNIHFEQYSIALVHMFKHTLKLADGQQPESSAKL